MYCNIRIPRFANQLGDSSSALLYESPVLKIKTCCEFYPCWFRIVCLFRNCKNGGGDKQSKFLNLETIDEHPQMKFFETSHWESHKWFHIAY